MRESREREGRREGGKKGGREGGRESVCMGVRRCKWVHTCVTRVNFSLHFSLQALSDYRVA